MNVVACLKQFPQCALLLGRRMMMGCKVVKFAGPLGSNEINDVGRIEKVERTRLGARQQPTTANADYTIANRGKIVREIMTVLARRSQDHGAAPCISRWRAHGASI